MRSGIHHASIATCVPGYDIDGTLMCWVLTVLLMLFMFCEGLAVVTFPWILMGTICIICIEFLKFGFGCFGKAASMGFL